MKGAPATILLALVLGAAGCASSAATVAAGPSAQARMVCSAEAQDDIAAALLMKPTAPVHGRWAGGVYSCTYRYPSGSFTLSVKDLASRSATDRYFASLGARLGRRSASLPIGADAAYSTTNGSVVARKDDHVLEVDVSSLPELLTPPSSRRSTLAVFVAHAVMNCWQGG